MDCLENSDDSMDSKCTLIEHDYCCTNSAYNTDADTKDNVLDKKFAKVAGFDAVDKWTDKVIVRASTGDDWNKKIAREMSILKVQYPYLPDQQIRGKAYKKFNIPAVMGGVFR